ncbi:MAG TPA: hypothetical protein VG167_06540 [Verrucomicrobiae bacterium]|nr:hypothetical protein [Verrucomicrobiae bacterium]
MALCTVKSASMRRFIITVLVATVLHAVACIIAPPFEFGHNRAECFFFAFVSGLLGFPVMFAIVLLPLRWGLHRFIPPTMQRAQAILAGLVLLGLATAWVFTHPTLPFQHGFYVHWFFWSTVAIAVSISFFWPFGARATWVAFSSSL